MRICKSECLFNHIFLLIILIKNCGAVIKISTKKYNVFVIIKVLFHTD